jgi:hypothetical protein
MAHDLGANEEDVYPADYFDLMGGVGFGGYAFHEPDQCILSHLSPGSLPSFSGT